MRTYLINLVLISSICLMQYNIINAQVEEICGMGDDVLRGSCTSGYDPPDYPLQRDNHLPDGSVEIKTINLFIHAFSELDGSSPTATTEIFESAIEDLNQV